MLYQTGVHLHFATSKSIYPSPFKYEEYILVGKCFFSQHLQTFYVSIKVKVKTGIIVKVIFEIKCASSMCSFDYLYLIL